MPVPDATVYPTVPIGWLGGIVANTFAAPGSDAVPTLALSMTLPSGMSWADPDDPEQVTPLVVMDRKAHGLHNVDNGVAFSSGGHSVKAWPTQSFRRAFDHVAPVTVPDNRNPQSYDAHFVLYGAVGKGSLDPLTLIPRLTKQGLYSYLDDDDKNPLQISHMFAAYLAIDCDVSDKKWTPDKEAYYEDTLRKAGEKNATFKHPTVFYRTRGGFRMVWALAHGISLEGQYGLEDYLRGLIGDAFIAGIGVDAACRDWTRLFRLPKVLREAGDKDSEKTWEQPYFSISYGRVDFKSKEACPDRVVIHDPARFRPISTHTRADYLQGSDLTRDLIERSKWEALVGRVPHSATEFANNVKVGEQPKQLDELLKTGVQGGAAMRVHTIKKRMHTLVHKHEAWDAEAAMLTYRALYEGDVLFSEKTGVEQLHAGIMIAAGYLCRHFAESPGMDPQILYAILISAAYHSNDMYSHRRSRDELEGEVWRAIVFYYRDVKGKKDVALLVAAEEQDLAQIQRIIRTQSMEGIVRKAAEQFLKWMPEYPEAELQERVKKCFIVQVPSGSRHVLVQRKDGELSYSEPITGVPALVSTVRDAGHSYINLAHKTGEDGRIQWKSENDILNDYGTMISHEMLSRKEKHNCVKMLDSSGTLMMVRAVPGFRQDIEPKEHKDVQEWLEKLGGNKFEKLLDWCAALPKLDHPIAALYLQKLTSSGKGMFGQAIRNMTVSRSFAPIGQALGDFQDSMVNTPFIWGDEEIGIPRNAVRTPMNTFKQLVTGEFETLNTKGKQHIRIDGYWRVLITANNEEALKFTQDVNENDMDAMHVRLLRITPSPEAVKYLKDKGGRTFTAGWPETKIPQHIMYLANTRVIDPGGRLYVEGTIPKDGEEGYMSGLMSTDSDIVLRALEKLLRFPFDKDSGFSTHTADKVAKIVTDTDTVLVSSEMLHDWMPKAFEGEKYLRFPIGRKIGGLFNRYFNRDEKIIRINHPKRGSVSYHQLILSSVIRQLHRSDNNYDFCGNGIITDDYYKKFLPHIYNEIVEQKKQQEIDEEMSRKPKINGYHHPAVSQETSNTQRPVAGWSKRIGL